MWLTLLRAEVRSEESSRREASRSSGRSDFPQSSKVQQTEEPHFLTSSILTTSFSLIRSNFRCEIHGFPLSHVCMFPRRSYIDLETITYCNLTPQRLIYNQDRTRIHVCPKQLHAYLIKRVLLVTKSRFLADFRAYSNIFYYIMTLISWNAKGGRVNRHLVLLLLLPVVLMAVFHSPPAARGSACSRNTTRRSQKLDLTPLSLYWHNFQRLSHVDCDVTTGGASVPRFQHLWWIRSVGPVLKCIFRTKYIGQTTNWSEIH